MKLQASWVLVCVNLWFALAHPYDVESNKVNNVGKGGLSAFRSDLHTDGDKDKQFYFNFGTDLNVNAALHKDFNKGLHKDLHTDLHKGLEKEHHTHGHDLHQYVPNGPNYHQSHEHQLGEIAHHHHVPVIPNLEQHEISEKDVPEHDLNGVHELFLNEFADDSLSNLNLDWSDQYKLLYAKAHEHEQKNEHKHEHDHHQDKNVDVTKNFEKNFDANKFKDFLVNIEAGINIEADVHKNKNLDLGKHVDLHKVLDKNVEKNHEKHHHDDHHDEKNHHDDKFDKHNKYHHDGDDHHPKNHRFKPDLTHIIFDKYQRKPKLYLRLLRWKNNDVGKKDFSSKPYHITVIKPVYYPIEKLNHKNHHGHDHHDKHHDKHHDHHDKHHDHHDKHHDHHDKHHDHHDKHHDHHDKHHDKHHHDQHHHDQHHHDHHQENEHQHQHQEKPLDHRTVEQFLLEQPTLEQILRLQTPLEQVPQETPNPTPTEATSFVVRQ